MIAPFIFGLAVAWAMGVAIGPAEVSVPYPAVVHTVKQATPEMALAPAKPLEGILAANSLLQAHVIRMFNGSVHASETMILSRHRWGTDAPSHLIMLDKWGTVHVADEQPGGSYSLQPEPCARLGIGRPLSFIEDANGDLIIAEVVRGLIMLERESRRVVQLAPYVTSDSPIDAGTPITFPNGMSAASDGTIYFTTSQEIPVGVGRKGYYDVYRAFQNGLLHGPGTGRLLAYYPHNKSVHVLSKGYMYANGVALAADESFVAFTETNQYRALRYWLKGPKAGTIDILVEGLPGAPDGISSSSDGNFWIAMVVARNPTMISALKYKLLRSLLAVIPITPPAQPWGGIMKVSPDGEILNYFTDPKGTNVAFVSSVLDAGERLYLGNVEQSYVSYVNKEDVGV